MAEIDEKGLDQPDKQQPLDSGSSWLQYSLNHLNQRLDRFDRRLRRVELAVWIAAGCVIVILAIVAFVADIARDALLLWMQQAGP